MPGTDFEKIAQDYRKLKDRLIQGDLSREDFNELVAEVTAGLSSSERVRLGIDLRSQSRQMLRPTGVVSMVDEEETGIELSPGTMLMNRWRILRELGRGGFGVVCLAEDTSLEDSVIAVKVLAPEMVEREGLLQRFRREVMVMRRLRNERIVSVFDYADDLSLRLAMITMEYVDGCDVQDLLHGARERNLKLPSGLVFKIFQQVLEALRAAHSEGVIHRDVTPGNILLSGGNVEKLLADSLADPGVKLVDFGLAALVENGGGRPRAEATGTISYVAPEISDPTVVVSGKADVYGIGAVIYEMLTGKTPFHTGSRPVEELRGGLPQKMVGLLNTCVRPDPVERPSADQALAALSISPAVAPPELHVQPPLISPPVQAVAPPVTRPPGNQAEFRKKPGMLLPILGVVALLLIAAGTAFWFFGRAAAPRPPEGAKAGERWVNPKTESSAQFLPARTFQMGCVPQDRDCSENEKPRHEEHVRAVWMDSKEVSVVAFATFLNAQETTIEGDEVYIDDQLVYDLENNIPADGPQWEERIVTDSEGFSPLIKFKEHPVVLVSWYGASRFCAWAGGRLPTEAEWESSARLGTEDMIYPTGESVSQRKANFSIGSERLSPDGTMKGGSFPPTGSGMFDLAGNAWEWVADSGGSGEQRGLRGGAWNSSDELLRSSVRRFTKPEACASFIGFRCVYGGEKKD